MVRGRQTGRQTARHRQRERWREGGFKKIKASSSAS